jgi:hypothetical protein
MRETVFEYTTDDRELLLVEGYTNGGATIRVRSLGGGYASIDLPVDQLADLGRKLLTRAAAFV